MTLYDGAVERFGASVAGQLRLPMAELLTDIGILQVRSGRAEEALRTCDKLERGLGTLADDEKAEPRWLAG